MSLKHAGHSGLFLVLSILRFFCKAFLVTLKPLEAELANSSLLLGYLQDP